MAENEGMEEKNLANEKKKEQIKIFKENVEKMKDGETKVLENGIVVTKTKGQYVLAIEGKAFGIVDEKYDFKYSKNIGLLEKELNEHGMSLRDLDLPDLQETLDLEEKSKRDEEQKEQEEQGEEEEIEEDPEGEEQDEEKDDEKPELEDDNDEQKEEIAKKYNVNASQVIHIAKNKKITDRNFGQIATWANDYKDVYIVSGEDEYSKKIIGVNKGEQEEIESAQKQIGGKNPDVLIKKIDDRQIEEIKPLCMYEIDDKSAIAIVRDEHGKQEAIYCRQEGGDKKTFWGTVIPEAEGKNLHQQDPEVREFMDYKNNSSNDLSDKANAMDRQKDLEYRGLPSQKKGVQLEEIDGSPKDNRQININDIKEWLKSRDGIGDELTVPPGYYDNKAKKVLTLMEKDKNISFDEAVETVEKEEQREEGGMTPGEKRNQRG